VFTVGELLQASKGRLIRGSSDMAVKGISLDSRTLQPGEAFIAIKGDRFNGHDFISVAINQGARVIIFSEECRTTKPPAKASFIQVRDTTWALGEIAAYHRARFNLPVIALSGSSGKTTAKEMIAHTLAEKFKLLKSEGTQNNHIGLPKALLRLNAWHDIAVLEIGSNHFGEVRNLAEIARPNIGIITNIGPAHLEYFGSLAGIYLEKTTLLDCLDKPHLAILNADDFFLRKNLARKGFRPFSLGFGICHKSDFFACGIKITQQGIGFSLNQRYAYHLSEPGVHNIYHALVAIAVARIFGLGHNYIARRLRSFTLPKGRGRLVELNKLRFIDDTYNANPASFSQALTTLANFKTRGRKILVMGDMLELGSAKELLHEKIGSFLPRICDIVIAVGELSRLAAQVAARAGLQKKDIFFCQTSWQAREVLFNLVNPQENDIILVKGSRAMHMEEVFCQSPR
jgi:UDP-N-acetylmuramoyl-tripeptide--D-alanyl-D-alanine ligase